MAYKQSCCPFIFLVRGGGIVTGPCCAILGAEGKDDHLQYVQTHFQIMRHKVNSKSVAEKKNCALSLCSKIAGPKDMDISEELIVSKIPIL